MQRYGEDGAIDWSLVSSEKKTATVEDKKPGAIDKSAIVPAAKPESTTADTAPVKETKGKDDFDDDELEALLASEEGLN